MVVPLEFVGELTGSGAGIEAHNIEYTFSTHLSINLIFRCLISSGSNGMAGCVNQG